MLGLGLTIAKASASVLTFVKDNLKLYLDFKSSRSDTLAFPSEGSTSFDGNDYIDASVAISSATDCTVSAWVFLDATGADRYLVDFRASSGTGYIYLSSANPSVVNKSSGTIYVNGSSGTTSITAGTWNHVCVTGISVECSKVIIGSHNGVSAAFWDGKITNVGLWSRALSPEEVQSIMNKSYSQLGSVEKTSLVSWWALDSATTGSNLIADSGFDDASYWSAGSGWSVNGTTASKAVGADAWSVLQRSSLLKSGVTYRLTADIKRLSGTGFFRFYAQSNFGTNIYPYDLNGDNLATYTQDLVSNTDGNPAIRIGGSALSIEVDDFTVQELNIHTDSHGSNNGSNVGATTTTSVYGGNAPILPRAIDIAESFAEQIGDGSALLVSGDTDYIEISDNDLLSFGNGSTDQAFSVSAWIYLNSITSAIILQKGNAFASSEYSIGTDANGKMYFHTLDDGGSGTGYLGRKYNTALATGEWYHFGATYDGSTNNSGIKLYLNGIRVDDTDANGGSYTAMGNLTQSAFIGKNDTTYSSLNISQLAIWKGLLSQEKIQSVMESTSYAKIPADVKSNLGSELIADGDFALTGTQGSTTTGTYWFTNAHMTIADRKAHFADTGGGALDLVGDSPFASTGLYKFQFEVSNTVSGSAKLRIKEGSNTIITESYDDGTHQLYFQITSTGGNFQIDPRSSGGVEHDLSNLSLKKVTNDLVAYYPLDADSEVKGLSFDGSDDKITFTRQVFSGAFTVSWWFNGDVNTNFKGILVDSTAPNDTNIGVEDTNGQVRIYIGSGKAIVSSVPNNEWCHIAFTRDGSGNIKSYLNGVASGTSTGTDAFALDTIGRNCVMSIASVSMYNVEKSANEVLSIYNDGIGGDESFNSGLVGYYKMDNATTVVDNSSNSNNGTVTGATLISAGTTDSVGNNDGGLY